jgi:hypothetical protein
MREPTIDAVAITLRDGTRAYAPVVDGVTHKEHSYPSREDALSRAREIARSRDLEMER